MILVMAMAGPACSAFPLWADGTDHDFALHIHYRVVLGLVFDRFGDTRGYLRLTDATRQTKL